MSSVATMNDMMRISAQDAIGGIPQNVMKKIVFFVP
jgi:hypothetical protein